MEDFLFAIIHFIRGIFKADETLAQESRFGESPDQRSSRRSCQIGCFVLLFVVVVIVAAGVVMAGWN